MIDYKNITTKEKEPSLLIQFFAVIGMCVFFLLICFLTTYITPETSAATRIEYVK